MSEQQSTATEPIHNATNGSHTDTLDEREMLACRSIIKECLKFNGRNAKDDEVGTNMPAFEQEDVVWNAPKLGEMLEKFKKVVKEIKELQPNFYRKMEIYNDPIHGSIQLNPLENAIVNTPEFYRLKEIKQLGGKSHVFPGAVHTRFEHSIGVCHLAGELLHHLRQRSQPTDLCKRIPEGPDEEYEILPTYNDEQLGKQEDLCVRLAGLCHDLGHGPFSHVFEVVKKTILGKKIKHEKISVMLFKRILLQHREILVMFVLCGLNGEHVRMIDKMIDCSPEIMKGVRPKEKYLYEIVANKSSGMDVDKWDYFARDCHYLGLKNEFDVGRCIALSSIVNRKEEYHIGFRDKEKRNIYGMFRTRCVLFQKAYYHKMAYGIEMMISDALITAQEVPFQMGGESTTTLKKILEDVENNELDHYILLTDSILSILRLCQTNSTGNQELNKAREIMERITKRDIYESIDKVSFYSDEYDEPHKKMKQISLGENYKIEIISIEYASEKGTDDPVSKLVKFFRKVDKKDKIPSITKEMAPESKVNIPKAFVEYQIRLYSKKSRDIVDDELQETKRRFQFQVEKWMSVFKKYTRSEKSKGRWNSTSLF